MQLYPGNPNTRFTDFLRQAGAEPDPVLPYVYAAAADDEKVVELIDRMADGAVDAIAFTSSPQVQRLFEVAAATRREEALRNRTARRSKSALSVRSSPRSCGGAGSR